MKKVVTGAAAMALIAGLAACSDDDNEEGANTLTITASDYKFEVEGEPVAGNFSIAVKNDGTEFHEIAMAQLAEGKTVEDFGAALANSTEEEDDDFGGVIEADSLIDDLGGVQLPGTSYTITGGGIEAGNYVLLCFIPNAEGTSHYELGMLTGFTVGEGESDDGPDADVSYTATDDALEGPAEIEAGETSIAVVNDSSVNREISLLKLKDGSTIDDVGAWFESGGDEAPDVAAAPLDFLAFVFDAEQDRTITVDLTPGTWAIQSSDPEAPFEGPPTEDPHAVIITVG